MESIQALSTTAQSLTQDGQYQQALELYSDAFNLLIAQSAEFAQKEVGAGVDEETLRSITPLLIQYSQIYLKRDLTAATILNAMGTLFDQLGDVDNAKQKFAEAIDCTPENMTYDEPHQNLADVSSRVIKTVELEPTDE